MHVKFDNRAFLVNWHHNNPQSTQSGKFSKLRDVPAEAKFTKCYMRQLFDPAKPPVKENIPIISTFEGVAKCHPKDQYCKDEGRKRSLALALKEGEFTYDERKFVWGKYFELTKFKCSMEGKPIKNKVLRQETVTV
jgi:hypothetical protein